MRLNTGKYKSAGDQLLRRDMSEAQAEQLGALLDDIFAGFVSAVSASRNKTPEQVCSCLLRHRHYPNRISINRLDAV